MEFEHKLAESGAEFSVELISAMYASITKMLPECFDRKFVQKQQLDENDPVVSAELQLQAEHKQLEESRAKQRQELAVLFPSLAQSNIGKAADTEEIGASVTRASKRDSNLTRTTKKDDRERRKSRSRSPPRETRSRSRTRSPHRHYGRDSRNANKDRERSDRRRDRPSYQEGGRHLLRKSLEQTECFDAQGRRIGPITGILLDDSNVKISRRTGGLSRNRMPSPDMWELKQLKGGQALHLVSDFNQKQDEEELDPEALNEAYTELELNEEEAPFLRGHTSRAGALAQEAIKVSKDPDGHMLKTAMKQS